MIRSEFKTKKDYQNVVKELCIPLKNYYSPGRAHLLIGETSAHYGVKTLGLEGFSRILWGLVPLWAGGGESCLDEYVTEGIICGTDRSHPEYWGDYEDGEQAYVEMGALAYGILMAPGRVWEPLDEAQRMNFSHWLSQINTHKISDNNWLFFRILVNIALRKEGAAYSGERLEQDLNRIEDFYLGEGWYSDGATKQRDYYISFAMHFYSLVYAGTMEKEDPVRCVRYKERASLFAGDFIYWFGERGEALPYGRSLTYRFAQGCFWSALAFADTQAFSWGVIKGIVNRHLRYWFSKPILDCENKLTVGYAYPDLHMCEGYNSAQSPYWALKIFLVLALPDTHPFWQAKEEPLPELKQMKAMPHAGMIVQREESGYVTALASGQYAEWEPVHCGEKYEKFAYSSYFGFQVPRSPRTLAQAAPDNMLAFWVDGGYCVRRRCMEVKCGEKEIWSKWSPAEGIEVETTLKPCGKGHLRSHVIRSERACSAVEGGFPLMWNEVKAVVTEAAAGAVSVRTSMGTSSLRLREGSGSGSAVFCEANVNLLYSRSVLPYLSYEIPKGTTKITVYVEGIPENEK